jgi:hypothetical protein
MAHLNLLWSFAQETTGPLLLFGFDLKRDGNGPRPSRIKVSSQLSGRNPSQLEEESNVALSRKLPAGPKAAPEMITT